MGPGHRGDGQLDCGQSSEVSHLRQQTAASLQIAPETGLSASPPLRHCDAQSRRLKADDRSRLKFSHAAKGVEDCAMDLFGRTLHQGHGGVLLNRPPTHGDLDSPAQTAGTTVNPIKPTHSRGAWRSYKRPADPLRTSSSATLRGAWLRHRRVRPVSWPSKRIPDPSSTARSAARRRGLALRAAQAIAARAVLHCAARSTREAPQPGQVPARPD